MTAIVDAIRDKLTKEYSPVHLDIVDESDGCGAKIAVTIVSEKFVGKPLLQRHRAVNKTLSEEIGNIHAFSQKTLTPDQWKK